MSQNSFRVIQLKSARSNHEIRIYEMIHVAPRKFFSQRMKELEAAYGSGFKIHHEGIKESPVGFDLMDQYAAFAKALNWEVQSKPAIPFENHDIAWRDFSPRTRAALRIVPKLFAVLNKQLQTLEDEDRGKFMEDLRTTLLNTGEKQSFLLRILLGGDIIDRRNSIAVAAAVRERQPVAMVWGKSHSIGMLEQFKQAGYDVVNEELSSISAEDVFKFGEKQQ